VTSASVGGSADRHRPVPESRRARDGEVLIRILPMGAFMRGWVFIPLIQSVLSLIVTDALRQVTTSRAFEAQAW
jgi:hypothetical protein